MHPYIPSACPPVSDGSRFPKPYPAFHIFSYYVQWPLRRVLRQGNGCTIILLYLSKCINFKRHPDKIIPLSHVKTYLFRRLRVDSLPQKGASGGGTRDRKLGNRLRQKKSGWGVLASQSMPNERSEIFGGRGGRRPEASSHASQSQWNVGASVET